MSNSRLVEINSGGNYGTLEELISKRSVKRVSFPTQENLKITGLSADDVSLIDTTNQAGLAGKTIALESTSITDDGGVVAAEMDNFTIVSFVDAGGGEVTVTTSSTHGWSNGDSITISGTTSYNGTFVISSASGSIFNIIDTWVADDGTGAAIFDINQNALNTTTDEPGNILNLVEIRDATTHEPITDTDTRKVWGLIQAPGDTLDGEAIGASAVENLQISFVKFDSTSSLVAVALTGDVEFQINLLYSEKNIPAIIMEAGVPDRDIIDPGAELTEPSVREFTVTTKYFAGEEINLADGTGAGVDFSISAFANAGAGKTTVTATGHTYSNGDSITISATTNYNGTFTIFNIQTNTFDIAQGFLGDDATGTAGTTDGVSTQSGDHVELPANSSLFDADNRIRIRVMGEQTKRSTGGSEDLRVEWIAAGSTSGGTPKIKFSFDLNVGDWFEVETESII